VSMKHESRESIRNVAVQSRPGYRALSRREKKQIYARVAIEGARDRAARHTLASAFSQVNIQDVDFDS